jgi:catechol 2,3-dioxygenase-like lactoylglutathione lyase family enzyme
VAYRFLLEVPETRIDEANITIGETGDAQVVVVRSAHGLGFDSSGADLTVAAHSLRVIDALYTWYRELAAPKPALAIGLHSGERLKFADHTRDQMVAAIRRDQPWVDRTIPKIGAHDRDVIPGETRATQPFNAPGPVVVNEPIMSSRKSLNFLAGEPVGIKVTELDRAERYYVDFLGADLLGRERINDRGEFEIVERDYNGAVALSQGTEADVSYLANGPVQIALRRVGRGARLERDAEPPVAVAVDRDTFLKLKGDAFMRGMEIISDQPNSLTVRDIYGLVWQFTAMVPAPALA